MRLYEIATLEGREGGGLLIGNQQWGGLYIACPPSGLWWGTMAAPMVQLSSNLFVIVYE